MNDLLQFADEAPVAQAQPPWQVLVVDDDEEVHAVTKLVFRDAKVDGRPVNLQSAYSAQQAQQLLKQRNDFALVLLDVVMESEHAGLGLVHYVRGELKNTNVRIVLRTGQPGQAPAREVMAQYEIDDYRTKTELNFERLHILVASALRTYRALNELRHKNVALDRSNQELERFAYVASHDLQTPLRGVMGFTQLLEKRLADSLDAECREYMDYISGGVRDMQRLIKDLLEYSRVGATQETRTLVDLNEVLSSVKVSLNGVLAQRNASLTVGDLPGLWGNRVLLEQLFRNLVDNALKFQPGSAPWVTVKAVGSLEGWAITVADGGIGINAAHFEQIFQVFTRLHTQEEYPGSGVGLPICRKIARLHGGELTVASTLGQGTQMVVQLPNRRA